MEEFDPIADSLRNKSILITGSTGFLAKIFVEKVLRIQPNVKQLFLIIRAEDAQQRLHDEVIAKELFRVLKDKYGGNFNSFISDKVTPVTGDISCVNLGVTGPDLKERLWTEIDIVVNIAATTKFDERYDVALAINTFGAKHVMDFAKKCVKLELLLHVSTAYVCGERSGLILEKPFEMGETLNSVPGLDIEHELKLVQEKRHELLLQGATEKEETIAMKVLGLQRSKFYGWPNTYVFTKSMGEMLLGDLRENTSLCIMRPTIITSTYKEPIPGWMEGLRTIDSIAIAYGTGKLTCFLGNYDLIVDIVPGDMVVNAMLAAMYTQANQRNECIYNMSSSSSNPLKSTTLRDLAYKYFTNNPWCDENGKPFIVSKPKHLPTEASFLTYIALRYQLPLKGLQMVNLIFCNCFLRLYTEANRKINFVLRAFQLYKPYMFFEGIFDDSNLENLRRVIEGQEETYYFDLKVIDWEDFFINTHAPGLAKYVYKR